MNINSPTATPPSGVVEAKASLSLMWRFPLYMLFVAGLTLSLRFDLAGDRHEGQFFTEYSAVELSSLVMLVVMALLYVHCAMVRGRWRGMCALLALMCTGALVREVDFLFDQYLPALGWQSLMSVVLIAMAVVGWRFRVALRDQIPRFAASHAFGILMAAFLTVAVFSRLFGMKGIWIDTLGPFYDRSAKNLAEEGVELLGYGLLLIGTIESVLWLRARRRTEDLEV